MVPNKDKYVEFDGGMPYKIIFTFWMTAGTVPNGDRATIILIVHVCVPDIYRTCPIRAKQAPFVGIWTCAGLYQYANVTMT